MNEYFFNSRVAFPWSVSPIGLPALAAVTVLLAVFTIWTYSGHPNATRRRILIVLVLRLLALLVALITAVRPSVGVQEDPKLPSTLLIGIDTSESMSVKDEVNNQSRINAIRKTLEKCQPILDELASEQNVNVVIYKFSTSDFNDTSKYTPGDPADGQRSDYATFLNKTFERWRNERLRGLLILGDGAHNGDTSLNPLTEAASFGRKGCPITTFTVGNEGVGPNIQDIVVASVECDPSPAPIKTDVTVIGTVHAYGFAGAQVVARVFINDEPKETNTFTLTSEKNNKIRMTIKAPPMKGEYKIKLQVGIEKDGEIVPLKGEKTGDNNYSESYLTVTKDGARILVIDRLRPELVRLRDALRSEKRFDVNEVDIQPGVAATAAQRDALDLDAQAYDVVIIGNVTADELRVIDPQALEKISQRVKKLGMGLMFLGGEHAFRGIPPELLPAAVVPGDIVEKVEEGGQRPITLYQTIPTDNALDKMMKLSKDRNESISLWNDLNGTRSKAKITGYNRMTRTASTTVYAWTTSAGATVNAGTAMPDRKTDPLADVLLAGQQIGDGGRGRVLALAAYDTYLWEKFGQPKNHKGTEIHTRFWKQCVLWLAHQDEEEGQAYARPIHRQLIVGGEQVIRVGVRLPSGADDPNAKLTVKIVPMPTSDKKDDQEREKEIEQKLKAALDKAKDETILRDKDGAKVLLRPPAKGEYFVELTSPKKDANGNTMKDDKGQELQHRATAKYIVVPDTSDEMMRTDADHDFLTRLATQAGGKGLRLEDLPGFLKELKAEPMATAKPKPRFYPDWRRNHSNGFLTLWFVLFVALLGAEWGLRRLWGMV